jgi:hypothetical protein
MVFTRRRTDRPTVNYSLTLTTGFVLVLVFKGLGIDLYQRGCIPSIYGDDFVMGLSCM